MPPVGHADRADGPYRVEVTPAAWRSLGRVPERLRPALFDFATVRLPANPYAIGYPLRAPFAGLHGAHYGRQYRVRYEIVEDTRTVIVHHFAFRGSAWRT